MKFGVREICDVVLRAKAAQKIGDRVFYKNEPVIYFDSLKTSTLEGASTTVYATGGRGNSRLIAWEGERTVTFTMEDALISPAGFSILTGAGLIDAKDRHVIMHTTERTDRVTLCLADGTEYTGAEGQTIDHVEIALTQKPYLGKAYSAKSDQDVYTIAVNDNEDYVYIMVVDDNGEVTSEPYIASEVKIKEGRAADSNNAITYIVSIYQTEAADKASDLTNTAGDKKTYYRKNDLSKFSNNCVVLADYYVEKVAGAFQVDITPDRFGGNFYLEASTLFRDTSGVDMPAEFIIPNCKVQSNFTFTMASTGDPSTFTFTMDAFPDYTRWNKTKKVLAAIQVIDTSTETASFERLGTAHDYNSSSTANTIGEPKATYDSDQKPYIEELY